MRRATSSCNQGDAACGNAAQRRAASQIRRVQYLGTTPLLEREADWARYQVNATRTRNEAVFRITYANGNQKIVLADRYNRGSRSILEAKYGNMGQMWDPTRELHIVGQAHTYLGITRLLGGDVGVDAGGAAGDARELA